RFYLTRYTSAEIYTLSYTTLFRSCRGDGWLVVPGEEPERHLLLRLRQLLQRVIRPRIASAPGRQLRDGKRSQVGSEHIRPSLVRSEEHTSALQSRSDLVCRLRLET